MMQTYSKSILTIFSSIQRNRELIFASTKREILGRYRGSFIGIFWSLITPIFMLLIFTFVFSVIFKARWGGTSGSKVEFALLLFIGLIVFNLFAECINRSPVLIISNINFVKKVVYPLEILPFVVTLNAFFHAIISLIAWFVVHSFFYGLPPLTIFYLPLILIPFAIFTLGLSWALAAVGVFFRDLSQLIALITSGLMFLSPIFYPVSSFPEGYRFILYINPITFVIEQFRNIVFWGFHLNFAEVAVYWIVSLFIGWVGFVVFQMTRKGFSDVL